MADTDLAVPRISAMEPAEPAQLRHPRFHLKAMTLKLAQEKDKAPESFQIYFASAGLLNVRMNNI